MSKEASLGQRVLAKIDTAVSKAFNATVSTTGDPKGKRIEWHNRLGKVVGVRHPDEFVSWDSKNTVILEFDADGKLVDRRRFEQIREGDRLLSAEQF